MIFKKQVYQADRRVHPFIGFLLFLISMVLLVVTGPLGFVYGVLHTLFTRGFRGTGAFLLKIAISVDQLGNVLMQHLLNLLWVRKGGYGFGNRDETISSALGRNKQLGKLTGFGKAIDRLLDFLDPNHSLNSIDYYIEPSEEIKEELSVELELVSLVFMGIFEAQADGHEPGILVRMTCYSGTYTGQLQPASEIAEIAWLNYRDMEKVAAVDKLIFNALKERGLLV